MEESIQRNPRENTEQSLLCECKLWWHGMALFSMQLGPENGDVFTHELGLEEMKIKETAYSPSGSGCSGLAESK